jgi:hypothetical protein
MLKPHTTPTTTSEAPSQAKPLEGDVEQPTVSEMVEASVTGEDQPMEKQYPTAPGALVWFTFPAILIALLLLGLLFVNFWPKT